METSILIGQNWLLVNPDKKIQIPIFQTLHLDTTSRDKFVEEVDLYHNTPLHHNFFIPDGEPFPCHCYDPKTTQLVQRYAQLNGIWYSIR